MIQILQQKCEIKGGTRVWRLRNTWLAWHSYKSGTFFIFLLWVFCAKKNCLAKKWGAIAPSAPPPLNPPTPPSPHPGVVGPVRAVEWNVRLNENDFTIIITKNHMKMYLMKNLCKNFRQLLKIWQLFSAKSIRLNTSSIKRGLCYRCYLLFFSKVIGHLFSW